MEVLLHRHDYLNRWPLRINSSSSPCLLPGDGGVELEVPALQSLDWFPMANNPHP